MFPYSPRSGLSRRHFLTHLAASTAWALPALTFMRSLWAAAPTLRKHEKAAILLWMGGGPATIDIWDLKPGVPTGGPFKPIKTTGAGEICEHLPLLAKQMKHLSIIRSMSTREADHNRGRYYLHTGFVPDPTIEYPSYGSVVAHELPRPKLEIPPFVAIDGGSSGPGFLGMSCAPFVVSSNGQIKNLSLSVDQERLAQRLETLASLEQSFIGQGRGPAALDHADILGKTRSLLTSKQMEAFKIDQEPKEVREKYGTSSFARGCLMARRLVETGVPFVEVDFGGWDTHTNNFKTLSDQKLPDLDRAMSALVTDLEERGLLDSTAIIWMGEFGRTPAINGNSGRDHWAKSWSAVVGGAGMKGGQVIGETSADGREITSEPFAAQDLMATILKSLGISLDITYTTKNGRPKKIANSGKVIKELFS